MVHLTIQQLSSHLDTELSEASKALVDRHLASCDACASSLARLAAQEEGLAQALTSDPDDEFFDRLTREVEERMRSARRVPPPARTLNPIVSPPSPLRDPLVRSSERRTSRPIFWPATFILAAIVGSAGFTIYGAGHVASLFDPLDVGYDFRHAASKDVASPESVARVADSIASEPAVPSPTQDPAAPEASQPLPTIRESISNRADDLKPVKERPEPVTSPGEEALPALPPLVIEGPVGTPREPSDTMAGRFGTLDAEAKYAVRIAQRRSEDAAARPSAVGYDAAALEWERSLPFLNGDSYREALLLVAESRFRAWGQEPSEERATRVAAAIRSYLVGATPGPDRERARRWLAQVEERGSH